jgi:GMP synthase (glutamine-hydrolysing)
VGRAWGWVDEAAAGYGSRPMTSTVEPRGGPVTGGWVTGDDVVLVVDFGAQYAQLIARRIREARVYSEIVPHTITAEELMARRPAGIVLSGGPASVHVEGAPQLDPAVYELGIPVLGICYGAQLLASQLGGEVAETGRGEYGRTGFSLVGDGGRLGNVLPASQSVWMSHFDAIVSPPAGFVVTGRTEDCPVAMLESPARGIYGVQFHPEVQHTPNGQELLTRFLADVCGCRQTWTMTNIIDHAVDTIRQQVGSGRAICGLSGGVDSAVAAALVHRAIGPQLTCVFVDTGLMRAGEADQVEDTFHRTFGIDLIHARAAERFFARLAGIVDPEEKRKSIGELFIRVFEEARGGMTDAQFLVQGTLYPDVIESGTSTAAKIKSHHNVGGLPEDLDFELVEPLRSLFKDEVRRLGAELGLPDEIVWRQPFPGPGLAVRIIGEVTAERVALLQQADAIVRDEIHKAGLDREIWQAFAVLADIRSVGVMGDERTYGHPIIIRAVTSEDAMTADFARLPYDLLERMVGRIIGEVKGINRVVYDITSKPPGTIEWE